MAIAFRMNPERVAYFEANGWRAYYERKWLEVLRLIVGLCQEQFHIPFPMTLLAAYYTTRASAAWVPVDHDLSKVLTYLTKFYSIVRRFSGLPFNVQHVADLELRYFDVHRRLVDMADKSEFIQTLVDLHSAIFGLSAAQAQESAEWRVKAANIVDLITSNKSSDPQADWATLEEYLSRCYASINRQLANDISLHSDEKEALFFSSRSRSSRPPCGD